MSNKNQIATVKKSKKSRSKKLIAEKMEVKTAPSTKKNTSLRLEHAVLKRLKIRAIEEDTSVQQLLETLVIQYLNQTK